MEQIDKMKVLAPQFCLTEHASLHDVVTLSLTIIYINNKFSFIIIKVNTFYCDCRKFYIRVDSAGQFNRCAFVNTES